MSQSTDSCCTGCGCAALVLFAFAADLWPLALGAIAILAIISYLYDAGVKKQAAAQQLQALRQAQAQLGGGDWQLGAQIQRCEDVLARLGDHRDALAAKLRLQVEARERLSRSRYAEEAVHFAAAARLLSDQVKLVDERLDRRRALRDDYLARASANRALAAFDERGAYAEADVLAEEDRRLTAEEDAVFADAEVEALLRG